MDLNDRLKLYSRTDIVNSICNYIQEVTDNHNLGLKLKGWDKYSDETRETLENIKKDIQNLEWIKSE